MSHRLLTVAAVASLTVLPVTVACAGSGSTTTAAATSSSAEGTPTTATSSAAASASSSAPSPSTAMSSMSMPATSTTATGGAAATAEKGAGGIQTISIKANDSLRFAPSTITAHVGMLKVTLLSAGSYPHNFSVPSLGKTSATVSGTPGEGTATLLLKLTKPGTVKFICTYHVGAGMVGHIQVKP